MAKEPRQKNVPLLTEDQLLEQRHILLEGIKQYNQGYFFEAHETWEDYWYPSPWPARHFLQGLIQVAAGFVHLMRREFPGTVRLLTAALDKLREFPPDYMGIDVAALIVGAARARDELEALGPDRFDEWDQARIPRIRLLEETKPRGRERSTPAPAPE